MIKIQREEIRKAIDELNGLTFNNSEPHSKEAKIFFEDRYFEVFSLLPKIREDSIGLEVGLAGGVLALGLKRSFNLNKLYSLEHPVAFNQYTKKYLSKLQKNNIIVEPVDLQKDNLPWADGFFDFIIFSEVMEHLIPADIPSIIRKMKKVLKKDGWLVITTPNIW